MAENIHVQTAHAGVPTGSARRISWGAVIAGVALALVIHMMLVLLGLAIGLAVIDPEEGMNGQEIGIGAAVWWVVSSLIALFIGAWVAGRLAGIPRRLDGALHGAVTWAAMILLSIYLLTSAVGAIVGGAFGVVRAGLEAGAPMVAPQAQQTTEEIAQVLQDPQARQQMTSILQRVAERGGEPTAADRNQAEDLLVRQAGMEPQQAQQTVDRWMRAYQQTRQQAQQVGQQAREVAGEAATVGAHAAFWSFLMILLGGVVGVLGGLLGAPRRLDERVVTA